MCISHRSGASRLQRLPCLKYFNVLCMYVRSTVGILFSSHTVLPYQFIRPSLESTVPPAMLHILQMDVPCQESHKQFTVLTLGDTIVSLLIIGSQPVTLKHSASNYSSPSTMHLTGAHSNHHLIESSQLTRICKPDLSRYHKYIPRYVLPLDAYMCSS